MTRIIAAVLAVALVLPAQAADRRRMRAVNISATSLFTVLSAAAQGKVKSRRDAVRLVLAGLVAGYGFSEAKERAGRGDVATGWLIANAASSLVENTASGNHPLSHIGYTVGPLRLRIATPADREHASRVDLDVSVVESFFLAQAIRDADDVQIRDGMLSFERNDPVVEEHVFVGYTWGIFPAVVKGTGPEIWNHEAVHAIQSQQLDSVEAPLYAFQEEPRFFRLRYLKAGFIHTTSNVASEQRQYHERWTEIEAYRLAQDVAPPPP
ncbi:MAG TPA: hypothetical protein VGF69_22180 [Thermoanaerobaculia bacterium]|jgi:hypothetical protein